MVQATREPVVETANPDGKGKLRTCSMVKDLFRAGDSMENKIPEMISTAQQGTAIPDFFLKILEFVFISNRLYHHHEILVAVL